MKKKLFISLFSLILLPLTVNAAVDGNTKTIGSAIADNANIKTLCQNAESENSGYTSATSGYYVECITIKCENSKNVHYVENGFSNKVTCANGNKNPKNTIVSSGADTTGTNQTLSLAKDASCEADSTKLDSVTGAYAFATRLYSYDCAYNADGSAFTSNTTKDETTTETKTTEKTTASSKDGSNNPKTGVEDYYKILIPSIIVVSGALYLVNKKNIFKKI